MITKAKTGKSLRQKRKKRRARWVENASRRYEKHKANYMIKGEKRCWCHPGSALLKAAELALMKLLLL